MSDETPPALTDFRSEIPLPGDALARSVYEQVVGASRQRRPLLARRRMGIAVVLGVLVFAAAAVAAVKEGPWWQSGEPPVDPQQVALVARDNLPANVEIANARTVVTDGDAALVAVPLNQSGYCLIPALHERARLGAQCQYQVRNPEQGDDDRMVSATQRPAGNQAGEWIVYGRVTDPRAAKVDLGPFSLELAAGGFFLGNVPRSDWGRLDGAANAGAILDGAGVVLRHGCVRWGSAPGGSAAGGESPVPLWSESSGEQCTPQAPPSPPIVDTTHATPLFDVTLAQNYSIWKAGQTLTFKAATAADGTRCMVATSPSVGAAATLVGGGCARSSGAAAGAGTSSIDVGLDAQLAHRDGDAFYAWSISGSVDPRAGIAKLELRSDTGSTTVDLGGGFFFAQLPATTPGPRAGTVPLPEGGWSLVGLDGSGNEVARVDLVALHERASPH